MSKEDREKWLQDIIVVSKNNMSDKDVFTKEQYETNKSMIKRRQLYLSPESIALDAYIIGGICFRINDICKDNVYWKIVTRSKSPASSLKKKERYQIEVNNGKREDSKIYDFIASKLVLQEKGGNEEDIETFSDKVKSEYNTRRSNTYLLASIIEFYKEQVEIGEFYTDNDRSEKKEKKDMDLDVCQKTFDYIYKNISIHNKNIGNVKVRRPNLEEYINQAIKELREEKSNDTIVQKYISIRKFLIAEQTIPTDVKDYQEEYYKYLISLLYNLKKSEYKECENSYNNINDALKRALSTFADLIENGFNNNVTIEYLKDLARWSDEFCEHLNDKLESQIIEELMSDSMYFEFIDPNLSVGLKENENQVVDIQKQCKANGYVSLHCDIIEKIDDKFELCVELQGMTGYRNDVATFGTASYGEKRLGATKADKAAAIEKERPIHLMPKYEPGKTYTDSTGKLKKIVTITGFGRLNEMTERQIKNWKKAIEKITPRYFTTEYNKETDSVEYTFHSIYESAEKYYTEINNRINRKKIREGFKIIKEENLLDNTHKKIVLTREQYKNFIINGGLKKLVSAISKKYENMDMIQEEIIQESNNELEGH